MLSHFPIIHPPITHSTSALPPPLCLYEGTPPPTHTLLPHCSSIPLLWGIKLPQDQRSPLLLLGKAILCYICIYLEP